MKRIFGICILALLAGLPAFSMEQDSRECVSFSWTDSSSEGPGEHSYVYHNFEFANNCDWPVYVSWQDNETWICAPYEYGTEIATGGSEEGSVKLPYSWHEPPRVKWCAEADSPFHPDYGTCGENSC